MKVKILVGLLLLFLLLVLVGSRQEEVVQKAVSRVKEGLLKYPQIYLHLLQPSHEDFTRIQSWIREKVPGYVESFLQDTIARCKNTVFLKEAAVDTLDSCISNDTSEETKSTRQLKICLISVIDSMLKEMEEGKGSLDFELDDVARTSLGDVYFHLKSLLTSNIEELKDCPESCGFTHPMIREALRLLGSSSKAVVKKTMAVLLGLPGMDSKFVRKQLTSIRSSLAETEDEELEFLVSFGEWMNDVLNGGLIELGKPFVEIRGELLELLGSTKDRVVPKIQEHLKNLEGRRESLGPVYDVFVTVVKKYFGQF